MHGSDPQLVAEGSADEAELVAGLRAGDAACYERVVRANGARMLAAARRIVRDEEAARDCVQDAFVRALRGIERFEQRSTVATWLHRIVVNVALTRLRAPERRFEESLEEREPRYDDLGLRVESVTGHEVPVERLIESAQTRAFVRGAIDDLPPGYRAVLIARDIEERDTRETAELLGLTPTAVKVRLHRARNALKTRIDALRRTEDDA